MFARPFLLIVLTLLTATCPTRVACQLEWVIVKADDRRFERERITQTLERIQLALFGFRQLTRLVFTNAGLPVRYRINPAIIPDDTEVSTKFYGRDINAFEMELHSSMQSIGHKNRLTAMKGYVFVNEAEKAALKLEVAKLSGASEGDIQELSEALFSRKEELESFLATSKWSD